MKDAIRHLDKRFSSFRSLAASQRPPKGRGVRDAAVLAPRHPTVSRGGHVLVRAGSTRRIGPVVHPGAVHASAAVHGDRAEIAVRSGRRIVHPDRRAPRRAVVRPRDELVPDVPGDLSRCRRVEGRDERVVAGIGERPVQSGSSQRQAQSISWLRQAPRDPPSACCSRSMTAGAC